MFKSAVSAVASALPDELKSEAKKRLNRWKGISEEEALVREATNDDKWGPHGEQLKAIARLTVRGHWEVVWDVLRERLALEGERWRQTYKALSVVEYLVANGDERIPDVVSRSRVMDRLMRFEYRDAKGKDEGVNVRHRAEKIKALIEDPTAIREVRERAERNRGKYAGMSSADARNAKGRTPSTGSVYSSDGGHSRSASVTESAGTREEDTRSATPSGGSQWDHVRTPSSTSFSAPSVQDLHQRAPSQSVSIEASRKAVDSSDDEAEAPNKTTSAPKIIFRDPSVAPPPAPPPGAFSFAPPPRATNAAITAVNYSSAAPVIPQPSVTTSSIDDLLGSLSGPSAPTAAPPAPAAAATSTWEGLDALFSAPAARAPPAPQQADPFASFGAAPMAQQVPANQFGFAPPSAPAHSSIPAPNVVEPAQQSKDPFGLASFGSPSAARPPSMRTPLKQGPLDDLAGLTADLGLAGPRSDSQSTNASTSLFGGSLI